MTELLQSNLGRALVVLPIVILGNIAFGLANGSVQEGFDRDKFKLGLFKGLYAYVGILLFVVVSMLMNDIKVSLSGSEYGLVDAMHLIVYGAIVKYAGSGIGNLAEFLSYKGGE